MSDFPWFKSYPSEVPQSIELNRYNNLVEIFDQSVKNFGDKIAYKNMDVEMSFNDVSAHVDALVWHLQNNTNLKKGDRIALQMPNLLQFPITIFACLKAGLVIVNTNPLYTAEEMRHQYKDSMPKQLLSLKTLHTIFKKYLLKLKLKQLHTTSIGDMLGGLKGAITNFVVRKIKKMVPPFTLNDTTALKQIFKDCKGKKKEKRLV